jgi:hypothetical protein
MSAPHSALLARLEKSKGGGDQKSPNHSRHAVGSDYRQAIEEAEVDERTAQRWQQRMDIKVREDCRYRSAGGALYGGGRMGSACLKTAGAPVGQLSKWLVGQAPS